MLSCNTFTSLKQLIPFNLQEKYYQPQQLKICFFPYVKHTGANMEFGSFLDNYVMEAPYKEMQFAFTK